MDNTVHVLAQPASLRPIIVVAPDTVSKRGFDEAPEKESLGRSSYKARHVSGRRADRPWLDASPIAANSLALSRESVPASGR